MLIDAGQPPQFELTGCVLEGRKRGKLAFHTSLPVGGG